MIDTDARLRGHRRKGVEERDHAYTSREHVLASPFELPDYSELRDQIGFVLSDSFFLPGWLFPC